MARGNVLSDYEKGMIVAYRENGRSQADIARQLGRSRSCICQFLQRHDAPQQDPIRRGRPKKISERSLRRVVRSVNSANRTCSQLIAQHRLQVSKTTLARALNQHGYHWKMMKRRPAWKQRHIDNRLTFARTHMAWSDEWKKVIFSDEKKFNLDGPDGYKYYWHGVRNTPRTFSKRVGGGGSVMLWCAFGYGGKFDLKRIHGRMNANSYQQMLEEVDLVGNGALFGGDRFIFQQDNAPPHSVCKFVYFHIINLI